jgi:3-oxoacyl-[acyl-carrier-protein] synthase II
MRADTRIQDVEPARRVAVTGVGVVSPIGFGREQFWSALAAGRSGIAPIEGITMSTPLPTIAAQVRGFAAREFITSTNLRRMGPLARMVVAAARMALDDTHLSVKRIAADRLGVVIGSALGNVTESAKHLEKVFIKGPGSASPMIFPNLVHNTPASCIAMELGATGVNLTVAQAEVSGEEAVTLGAEMIRTGRADVVLAGGGDELAPIVAETCFRARALSGQHGGPEWCSPYDRLRNGLVLGEGAAVLVLESLEHARGRGATVLAEIEGTRSFAVPAPLYDWPARAPAAVEPLRRLVTSSDVDLIVGSANASRRVDSCEIEIFSRVSPCAVVTSIKGAIGEFGAAGAFSLAAACLAVREQSVPPLCHLQAPDPVLGSRLAARTGAPARVDRTLVCGLARGGAVAGLLLRRVPR